MQRYRLNEKHFKPETKVYKVRKFFLFRGKGFKPKMDFEPAKVGCSERKTRLLFERNLIFPKPEAVAPDPNKDKKTPPDAGNTPGNAPAPPPGQGSGNNPPTVTPNPGGSGAGGANTGGPK